MADMLALIQRITQAVSWCINQEVKSIDLNEGTKLKFKLRDNLAFRLNSLFFHLDLTLQAHFAHAEQVMAKGPNQPNLMNQAQHELQFLFDDIVFNSVSAFDYLARFISVTYLGEHCSLKWPSLLRASSDKKNKMFNFQMAALVRSTNQIWVDKLYEYRSEVIHTNHDQTESSIKTRVTPDSISSNLFVKTPPNFSKTVPFPDGISGESSHIYETCLYIVGQTLFETQKLIKQLQDEKYPKPP